MHPNPDLPDTSWRSADVALTAALLALVWVLHGAVPLLASPTLGHVVWAQGFAQSLAHQGWLALWAVDFGLPAPAGIALGLSGVWPCAAFIRLGMNPVDAYSSMVALWLAVAFAGAHALARHLGSPRRLALLLAAVWLSLPMIWFHAHYSMVGLGFALLPTYFWSAIRLMDTQPQGARRRGLQALVHSLVAVVAVFMDGYSFMMYAVGTGILGLALWLKDPQRRPHLLRLAGPLHAASLAGAYFLYRAYLSGMDHAPHPLSFFRSWAVDLHFLFLPTQGFNALMDALKLSVQRDSHTQFGDGSVWLSTYALPLILAGTWAWWSMRKRPGHPLRAGLWPLTLFSLYMALGPSVKYLSTDYAQLHGLNLGQMPAEAGLFETGNAWISQHLPGFNVMRASYRWVALMLLALWLMLVFWAARFDHRRQALAPAIAMAALVMLQLPNLFDLWSHKTATRATLIRMDQAVSQSLAGHSPLPGPGVMLPMGNDFLANYIAARHQLRLFNIGGDKNGEMARRHWPPDIRSASRRNGPVTPLAVRQLLLNGTVATVWLPHFDMNGAAYAWPCSWPSTPSYEQAWLLQQRPLEQQTVLSWSPLTESEITPKNDLNKQAPACPPRMMAALQPLADELAADPWLQVQQSALFTSIQLSALGQRSTPQERLARLGKRAQYPIQVGTNPDNTINLLLGEGWHTVEDEHVWSQDHADLWLPAPPACQKQACEAVLQFMVFGASPQRPVEVEWQHRATGERRAWTVTSGQTLEARIPLPVGASAHELALRVPDAASPARLGVSADERVLGVGLRSVNVVAANP